MVLIRTRCGFFLLVMLTIGIWLESSAGSFPIPDAAHLLQPLPPLNTTKQPHSTATDLFSFQFYSESDQLKAQSHRRPQVPNPGAPTPDCPEQLPLHTSKAPRELDSSLHLPAVWLPYLPMSLNLSCPTAFYLLIIGFLSSGKASPWLCIHKSWGQRGSCFTEAMGLQWIKSCLN